MTILIVFRMCTSVPYTSEEWSIPLDFFWHMGTSDRLLLDTYWLSVINQPKGVYIITLSHTVSGYKEQA